MKLTLKHIGIVRSAEIRLDGITVIGGENNTGKSTVSKTLYAVFNGFYNCHERARQDQYRSIRDAVRSVFLYLSLKHEDEMTSRADTSGIVREIMENRARYARGGADAFYELFSRHIPQFENHVDNPETAEKLFERIRLRSNYTQQEIIAAMLHTTLKTELSKQVVNVYGAQKGEILFEARDRVSQIQVEADHTSLRDLQEVYTRAIYIDDPFVVDELNGRAISTQHDRRRDRSVYSAHRSHLAAALYQDRQAQNVTEELAINQKLDRIYRKVSDVCGGKLEKQPDGNYVYLDKDGTPFQIQSLSTGLKSFVILKQLLLNGALEENGTIILDEPEIHLHPEWQLVLAELIVLLRAEFGMHVLINTHSPYFLRAIQVYAARHAVADQCKYYLARREGRDAVISDVSDDIESIYELLAAPFQRLEELRWREDESV